MSDRNAKKDNSKTGIGRGRGRTQQAQTPQRPNEAASWRSGIPDRNEEEYPTLEAAKSIKTPAPTPSRTSSVNTAQATASNIYPAQSSATNSGHAQYSSANIRHNTQPLMPSSQLTPQPLIVTGASSIQPNYVAQMSKQSGRRANPVMNNPANIPQAASVNPPTTTNTNNNASATTAKEPIKRPLSQWETEVATELYKIMLQIHGSKEFVSLEEILKRLFRQFRVSNWKDLRVHPTRFDALINHEDKLKNISLYLHVFEQVFHICTLQDFESYLLKFMEVDTYDELRVGPLDKHPEIQRVFKYRPIESNQPIPTMTTGEIIERFMEFLKKHRHQRQTPTEEFLDELVKVYEVQSRDQLAIFHRGWPHLIKVINKAQRDQDSHKHRVKEQMYEELLQQARKRLEEVKEEMRDAAKFSKFNSKKTPTSVFNYLTSLVEKHLDMVPQQMILYTILAQFREDELLQCLFNICIYLGTIDQPEVLIAELKEIYQNGNQNSQTTMDLLLNAGAKLSKKERRKLNNMSQQQNAQANEIVLDDDDPNSATPIETCFAGSLRTLRSNRPKPPISFKELCSDIYNFLEPYDTILTIEQLIDIEGQLCAQHGVPSFSIFSYDEYDDDDDQPTNLVSFLNKHHHVIDPTDELSIYQHTVSSIDRTELYPFIQQLHILNDGSIPEQVLQQAATPLDSYGNTPRLNIGAEKLSAVEKAVKHKFGGSIGTRIGNRMIAKAKQRHRDHHSPIVRFEEALLDVHGLDRLDICPHALNVNETKLCQLILNCPLMIDLYQWFQWLDFFQPKYGSLKSFIDKHKQKFRELRLLETSNRELFRLPSRATLATFEQALKALRIRTAVGELCGLIVQEGSVTQISFNVYRTSMITWFRQLRSESVSQNGSLQCILDFLMYLPKLIGQSRIVDELVIRPLDEVFGGERVDGMNARKRLWHLADVKQRTKLELWGYTVDIPEWQNEEKWSGLETEIEERSHIRSENTFTQATTPNSVTPATPTTPVVPSSPMVTPNAAPVARPSFPTDGNQSAQTAFDHIEAIRHGFGVNSGLDSDGQSIVTNLQGMVARSLEKLSNDLFSDQGHFVLELIQNADDNQYTEDRLPTLRFFVSPERVLVCNNEKGFRPEDIAAICNVGASTKGKHKQGYVGHKGIGFKSVFMVSHRPEIHSRDYHLRFDTVNGKEQIGYIRPIWLDQYEEALPDPSVWTTCIRLPIKQDTQRDRLQQNFDDVQGRLLLFLNRLRQMEIINQQDNNSTDQNKRVFMRIDHAQVQTIDDAQGQIIELQEKATDKSPMTNLWLVVKKIIDVPHDIKMKLRDTKGEVNSTTIAIAYSLSDIKDSSDGIPPKQPLFAYLPLNSYGFRFILQGDFEITANRQEIRRDSLWNDWLRSEMSRLLALAYRQFQRLPDLLNSVSIKTDIYPHLNPMQMIKYFLKLIPTRYDAHPYFNVYVDDSIRLLMGIIELPVTRQNDKNETVIEWVSPSRCILVQDTLIRKLLSQDLLLSHFNCYYVHEELGNECDKQILLKLGCRPLEFKDITQLIESSYKQDEQRHLKTPSSIEQIAQWLLCLDYSLEQERHEAHHLAREKETIARLKKLKMIPLKHETHLVSVDEYEKQGISLPSAKSAQLSKHLKLVLDDLPTLDEQLLDAIEDKNPRQLESVKRLLQKLGIKDTPKIQEIYRRHILTVMANQTLWLSKSESILIAYILCIYEYIYLQYRDLFDNDLKTLRKTLVVKTQDNTFVSLGTPDLFVHLTSKYAPETSVERLKLSKHKFTFISNDYLKPLSTDVDPQKRNVYHFVSFLKELNITDTLQMNFIDTSFLTPAQLADTQWAYLVPSLKEMIYDPFKIKDFACEEFNKLVAVSDGNQTPDRELCAQLLQYLDANYETISANYGATIVLLRAEKAGYGSTVKIIDSSFCSAVRQHAWIPVDGGLLLKPSDVYLIRSNSETVAFRRYVPHVDMSILTLGNADFVYKILGIKSEVAHQTMFELLMKWSCNLDSESLWKLINDPNTPQIIPCTLPTTFRQTCLDTVGQLRQIYRFLASDDTARRLLHRFRLWPLIFIPQGQQTGAFVFAHQTFWNDPTSLLASNDLPVDSKNRIPILPYYGMTSGLEQFFIEILHVESQPTIDDYLPLIATIQDVNQIWIIIERTTKLAIELNKQTEIQEKYRDLPFIPCLNNRKKLAKYTDHPFYPHDSDITELFIDTVPIIRLPDSGLSKEFEEQFCSLFNIENLDEVIQKKITVENEEPSTSLTEFYRSSIDLIQHFLLSTKLITNEQSDHLSTLLSSMQFLRVDRMELTYCHANTVKTRENHRLDTYVEEETSRFYILKKFEQSEMRYTEAMAHFLVKDETARLKLARYIQSLVQTYQEDGTQGFEKQREKITENYQSKWTIPEEKKKDVPVDSSPIEAVKEPALEPPTITQEMIDELINERSNRPILPPRTENKENINLPNPFLPALNPTNDPSKIKSNDSVQHDNSTTISVSNRDVPTENNNATPSEVNVAPQPTAPEHKTNDQDHQVPEDRPRKEPGEHTVPKTTLGDFIEGDASKRESKKDGPRSDQERTGASHRPFVFQDSDPLPAPVFEQISVSTLPDFDLSSSSIPLSEISVNETFQSSDDEADAITGRQGEALIFQYLKQTYPNAEIKWMNEEKESYQPYDISIKTNAEDEHEEFIEVKTTRSINQYTFPISIGEVQWLLKHPANYFIYRVYYAEPVRSSTITKITRVKENLKWKHIKLLMTVPFQSKN